MTCSTREKPPVNEINTATCAEEPCVPPVAAAPCVVSSCTCGCNPCQCQSGAVPIPQPFYNEAKTCQEDHTKLLIQQNFITAVSIGRSFNIPACNVPLVIYIPGIQQLLVGGYLWNPVYGYFKITAFSYDTSQVTIINECQAENAAVGTEVPSCTLFNVVDKPFEPEQDCGEGVFVTADFTVPAVGSNVTIQVTGLVGIKVQGQVQIVTGTYTVMSIVSPASITIRNTGSAPAPGTVVSAHDTQGNCIAPVTPVLPDPCDASPAAEGALVVCTASGMTTLNANVVGQVPVCTNPSTNHFEARDVALETLTCGVLHSCFSVATGATTAVAYVVDSSIFSIGDIVIVSYPGLDTLYWVVADIDDVAPNTLSLKAWDPTTVPSDFNCVPIGTPVCIAGCCQQMRYDLTHPCNLDWSQAQQTDKGIVWEGDESAVVLSAGDPAWASDIKTITIKNDTWSVMEIMVTVDFILQGTFDTGEDAWARVSLTPAVKPQLWPPPGGGPTPVPIALRTVIEDKHFGRGPANNPCNAYDAHYWTQYHHTEIVQVPAQQECKYSANFEFTFMKYKLGSEACDHGTLLSEGSGDFTITGANTYVHAIAVAVLEDGCSAPI